MRILGIDPGSFVTGYGVVEEKFGKIHNLEFGIIRPARDHAFLLRLSEIYDAFVIIVERLAPDEIAVENPFYHRNVKSMLQLVQARAAALLPAVRAGLPVFEYAPREIKLAVAGTGNAEKEQVARMVALLLGHTAAPPSGDAADALAAAICHSHRSQSLRRLQKSLA
ncbi:MAG: crossover junction endodeoxyribonuclease RuvC [Acidobacteria bacterium]|nr:crossover junction endodeoxyribonuclease RuvC [Acidobacteriota bacterium]